jgi:hypothetical protein
MMIKEFIERACANSGLIREKYTESNLPIGFNDFIVVPFFGDKRHEFVLATSLLGRLKDKYKKYLILCGWEGHSGFFPMNIGVSLKRLRLFDLAMDGLITMIE